MHMYNSKFSIIMSSIKRYLSDRTDAQGRSEVCLRLSVSRDVKHRLHTGLLVPRTRFKDGRLVAPRAGAAAIARIREADARLYGLERDLLDYVAATPAAAVTRAALQRIVAGESPHAAGASHGDAACITLADLALRYVHGHELAETRRRSYMCTVRMLHRYARWRERRGYPEATRLTAVDADTVRSIETFYRDEWQIGQLHPDLYDDYPPQIAPAKRGRSEAVKRGPNTVTLCMKQLRAICRWGVAEGLLASNPFAGVHVRAERYGRPVYLTIEERDRLAAHDFGEGSALGVQRDVFIFQCLIGCRVSDLRTLTKQSVVEGAVEYVPRKTAGERSETVRVPLNSRASAILERYTSLPGERLLPCISDQKYNVAIKRMLREAGVDREVTVIDPVSGLPAVRRLWEVASSHMARRTFVGNLYKRVKDPALIGSMSGHKEGSRAFARYRDIDDDIKRELVGLLE